MLCPLKFEPIFKQRLWGGRRLARLFGKPLPPGVPIGESWELSGLAGVQSVVVGGPLGGGSLGELVDRFGADLLGRAPLRDGTFPLLIKLLDAREPLSVQVHPGPAGGARPKSECWYVIDAEPGACVWIGLNDGVDHERLAEAVHAGAVEQTLHVEPARAGDVFYVPAGTVHALGAGLVVAEVQTPSDTTYRLFDWNRVDAATGRPRALHVDEALGAIDYSARPPRFPRSRVAGAVGAVTQLLRCEHFAVEKVESVGGAERELTVGRMTVWQVLRGRGEVRCRGAAPVAFRAGDLVLLPAAMGDGRVSCHDDCVWLSVTIPQSESAAGGGL